jgi:hypothetical protein
MQSTRAACDCLEKNKTALIAYNTLLNVFNSNTLYRRKLMVNDHMLRIQTDAKIIDDLILERKTLMNLYIEVIRAHNIAHIEYNVRINVAYKSRIIMLKFLIDDVIPVHVLSAIILSYIVKE